MNPRMTLLAAGFAALAGCNSQPPPVPTDRLHAEVRTETAATGTTPNARQRIDRPEPSKVKFDEASATLSLYDLPQKGARWMVSTPKEPNGVPVPRVYTLKGKPDPRQVSLYFTVPSGGVSGQVSLQEVLDAQRGAAQ